LTLIFFTSTLFHSNNNLILATIKKVQVNKRASKTCTSETLSMATAGQIDEDSRVGETKSESKGINKGNSSQALSYFHLWR
jgi:hypothetical protein